MINEKEENIKEGVNKNYKLHSLFLILNCNQM
jgi:hypothetical protein